MDVVKAYRRRRKMRLDARGYRSDDEPEEEGGRDAGGHGNTKLPFGLCQREGIEVQKGWTPHDAWEALAGRGYNAKEVYEEIRKTGKVAPRQAAAPTAKYSRPEKQNATVKNVVRKIANLKNEQRFIVDKEGNIIGSARGDKHSVGMTLGELRDKMPGNVAVHNHPEGGTFSPDDLKTFGLRAVESVVATKDGTYSLVNKMVGTKDQTKGWYDMKEALEKEMESGEAFEEYRMPEYKLRNKVAGEIRKTGRYDRMGEITTELLRMRDEEGVDLSNLEGKAKDLMEEYTNLEQQYKGEVARETRRRITKPFDDFYKQNAEKYGFEYSFTPTKKRERKLKAKREETPGKVETEATAEPEKVEAPKKRTRAEIRKELYDSEVEFNRAKEWYDAAEKEVIKRTNSLTWVKDQVENHPEQGLTEEDVKQCESLLERAKKKQEEARGPYEKLKAEREALENEMIAIENGGRNLSDIRMELGELDSKCVNLSLKIENLKKEFDSLSTRYEMIQDPEIVKEYNIPEENIRSIAEDYNRVKKELEDSEGEYKEANEKREQVRGEYTEQAKYPKSYVRTRQVMKEVQRMEKVFSQQPYECGSCVDKNGKNLFKTTDHAESSIDLTFYRDAMKDAVLTHNHPNGTTFSAEDISTAVSCGVAEIRACTKKGAFSLVRLYSLDEGPTDSQREFSWRFSVATKKFQESVDEIWESSQQLDEDADKCNKMFEDMRRNWLKKNARHYGWEYTEELEDE